MSALSQPGCPPPVPFFWRQATILPSSPIHPVHPHPFQPPTVVLGLDIPVTCGNVNHVSCQPTRLLTTYTAVKVVGATQGVATIAIDGSTPHVN